MNARSATSRIWIIEQRRSVSIHRFDIRDVDSTKDRNIAGSGRRAWESIPSGGRPQRPHGMTEHTNTYATATKQRGWTTGRVRHDMPGVDPAGVN
jgi:hypothetical protein